ncbi:MAG TPA: FdhF/YdeP family oxidoreductase [Candidatus Binatia bacterium]|jgi:molybdopterin-dependent oxidoreductase alpha subunit|nr:FdhF/YdeP family oxidoreductase [Candidatus Binatia bacterium]
MPTRKLQKDWRARLKSAVPFGLGQVKPKHFRDMAAVAWKNRDNLAYAWKVLSRGVCDGCALGVAGFHDWTIDGIHLCLTRLNLLRLNTMPALEHTLLEDVAKLTRLNNAQLRELGRLPFPMLREKRAPGFRRISWDEALRRVATRIRVTGPKRLAFYLTSRGVTNEVYYVAQKVARFLGTNNIDNAARLCHAPSTAAMKHALGVAATTCSYKDWYGTDLVIFFGANPANDQPVAMKYLHEAKKLGTKVVLVNPYREPGMERYWVPSTLSSAAFGTDIMDYWFPVSTGGDIAFLCGVLKVLFLNGWQDREFIRNHTVGFEALEAELSKLEFEALEAQSGLERASMEEFAMLVHRARNAVLVWSMGVTQHAFGGDTVQMILNLGLAKGFVGRDKCGLMPIRGHSSVQGGAEMGAYSTAFPGGKPINAENAAALAQLYGFSVPDWRGLTAPEMVEAAAAGELDLLYCLGGNFLRTLPEPEQVRLALANVPARVHQDIILTDQMFIEAREEVILLPAKTRYEQDDGGTETSTERRIMFSPELPRQVGEARAEWKILRDLAAAVCPERAHLLGCETGWQIRQEIPRVVPFYEGVQGLKEIGDAVQYGGPHLCAGGKFPTPDGKAHFRPVPLPRPAVTEKQPDAGLRSPARFIVSTRRGKQFNSLVYAEVDPINGVPRDAVLMSREDAVELHLSQHDRVLLENEIGRFEGRVFLAPIARGNLQIHWPEGNVLIRRGVTEPTGGVPDYNTRVSVQRLTNGSSD